MNAIVPKNSAPKTCQAVCKRLGDGTCIASLAGSGTKNAQLLARVFRDKYHPSDCAEKLCAQDLSKFPNQGTCMVDGGETVGNSLHGESCVWRERDGSDDRVDGGETVGNSFGRAPRERRSSGGSSAEGSEMEAPDERELGGWHGFCRTISINAIVLKYVGPRRGNSWGRAA